MKQRYDNFGVIDLTKVSGISILKQYRYGGGDNLQLSFKIYFKSLTIKQEKNFGSDLDIDFNDYQIEYEKLVTDYLVVK